MWGEITYQFPYFNGTTVEVWGWINNFPRFTMHSIYIILSMVGLKLHQLSKRGPRSLHHVTCIASRVERRNVYTLWCPGLSQGLRAANERRCYFVTTSLSLAGGKPRISPDAGSLAYPLLQTHIHILRVEKSSLLKARLQSPSSRQTPRHSRALQNVSVRGKYIC